VQQRQPGQHPGAEPVGLGVLVVVIPQVGGLLGWDQDHLAPLAANHPASGTQALRVGSMITST
jgi:hypothetical protein